MWAQPAHIVQALPLSMIRSAADAIRDGKDEFRVGRILDTLYSYAQSRRAAIAGDSIVVFLYRGEARHVSVAGDFNGWSPISDTCRSVEDHRLWYLIMSIPPGARFEYKLVVDSTWVLDPLNSLRAAGGFGENSEIRMTGYESPQEIIEREGVLRGRIDTLFVASKALGYVHPAYIYLPEHAGTAKQTYPTIVVTDGGEFLTLGRMNTVLDNLIADGRIPPVIAVFLDPRTNPADPSSNKRMSEYAMNDDYVSFLADELLPLLRRTYPIASSPDSVAISGASMGGLIATYAAFRCPDVFGSCAAQSPSYWWKNDSMITIARQSPRKPIRLYLDTGILHDAQKESRRMRAILQEKGYELSYAEYPEGHNWANWRARLASLLTFFWGYH